jgi:stromal interaction molecule 1
LLGIGDGCNDDVACLALASQDRIGLEAIKSLHRQLDDDANGNVDLSESDEVKECELFYYVCIHILIMFLLA